MSRRGWCLPIALLAFAAISDSAPAAGGTYVVVQCAAENRGDEAVAAAPFAYHTSRRCDSSQDDNALRIDNVAAAQQGRMGLFSWKAPPDTGIVRIAVGARLRREKGHRAMLVMTDADGRETHRVAVGDREPTVWRQRTWSGAPQRGFSARLPCMASGGCAQSNLAKTYVRNVRLTLVDQADPEVTLSGSLFGSGWHRGDRMLSSEFTDHGSGLADVLVRVNGVLFRRGALSCLRAPSGELATHLVPCAETAATGTVLADTTGPPFLDGVNIVRSCSTDFAGNQNCESRVIWTDN
ncbi:MAG TPA: hypothetical protein VK919_06465, partial [Solirubrobacterales bacterium]|nr:hypothetical protein [Solirubrobacterales bacterium]